MWLAAVALPVLSIVIASDYDQSRLIALARQSVIAEVRGSSHSPDSKSNPPLPVFVTIEVGGVIRGCRGSLDVRTTSLEAEIEQAAKGAAAHDPRYRPLTAKELNKFLVTVTIVERKEPITTVSGLRPEDGLALQSGGRWGIVLPWEGKDPLVRLKWAYQKAGVAQGTAVSLFRLCATRFRG